MKCNTDAGFVIKCFMLLFFFISLSLDLKTMILWWNLTSQCSTQIPALRLNKFHHKTLPLYFSHYRMGYNSCMKGKKNVGNFFSSLRYSSDYKVFFFYSFFLAIHHWIYANPHNNEVTCCSNSRSV